MTRRPTTVVLNEVIEVRHAVALRRGVTEDQLMEDAVRWYVGLAVLDELRARARLSPEEAEAVAAEELRVYRAERRVL